MSMTTPRTRIAFHPKGRSFLAILFASLFLVGTTIVNVHVITRDFTADLVVSTDFLTMDVPQGSRASDVLLWNVSPLCIASDEFAASQHPRGMQFWEYINQTARGIFSYARLHNIFTSPEGDRRGKANAGGDVVQRYENGTLWYNWTIVENVLDAIVSCDIIPYIELGFMPVLLSSQPESAPERREPADYSAWEALVRAFLDIVGSRYGNESLNAWRFEVWNEPDISNFWRDTREGYFRLYNSTARVIKAYSPLLKVGGPALASEIDFLGDFLDFCDGNDVPLDFISFHAKGGSGGSDTYPHHDKVIERIPFYYPKQGIQEIYDKMAEFSVKGGSVLETGITIKKVHHDGTSVTHVSYEKGGKLVKEPVSNLISSMPITELVQLLEPAAPEQVIKVAKKLGYRDQIQVFLIIDKPHITEDTWIYFPTTPPVFGRMMEPKNWYPAMAPEKRSSLLVEYFVFKGDGWWNMSDQAIIDKTLTELQVLGFVKKSECLKGFVYRIEKSYPMWDLDYKKKLDAITDHLDALRNLYCVGRNGRYFYNNQDHSIETGLLAAQSIVDGKKYDLNNIGMENTYFEAGMLYKKK